MNDKRRKIMKKNYLKTMTSNVKSVMTKIDMTAVAASAALLCTAPAQVFAGEGPGAIVKAACDVIVKMFPYIGSFFILAGVFKLILAYRNDQPEAQASAAKDIVIGAVFVVFATFVWPSFSGIIFAA